MSDTSPVSPFGIRMMVQLFIEKQIKFIQSSLTAFLALRAKQMQGKAMHQKQDDTIQCLESIIKLKIRKQMKGRTVEDGTKLFISNIFHSNS
jgi:hypothetical protein